MRLMIDAPGALTTVQDLGRTGVAHLGFCTCGAKKVWKNGLIT